MKYYMCGEYGSICRHGEDVDLGCKMGCTVGRPHYHACIFNCSFSDRRPYRTERERIYYTSAELQELWGKGFVDVGSVTMESAAYTARYVMKKVTGVNAEEHYRHVDEDGVITDLVPEYSASSNGLGAGWYEQYKSDVYPSDETPVPGSGGKIIKTVPRYYDEKLRLEDEAEYNRIKAERKAYALENPEEFTPERLYSKFKVKKAQIETLSRKIN